VAVAPGSGLWRLLEKSSLPPSLIQFILSFSFSGVTTFLTIFAQERHIGGLELYYIIAAAVMALTRLFVGRLYDRYGSLPVLVPGLLFGAANFVILAFASSSVAFYVTGALYGLSLGICLPTLNAQAVRKTPAGRIGVASTTFWLFVDLGVGLGGMFWGFMIDAAGYTVVYCSAAVCVLAALAASVLIFRKKKSAAAAGTTLMSS
jgi:predicted MFS family arabinose efflux permease